MSEPKSTAELVKAAIPALTEEYIDSIIVAKSFSQPDPVLTICVLTLANGYKVTGQNACSTAKHYDRELGERYSFEDARNQVWPLEGYLFKQRQFENGESVEEVIPADSVIEEPAHETGSVDVLLGSDAFPAELSSLDKTETFTLGDVVRHAFGHYVGTYEDWNRLTTTERDARIARSANELTRSNWIPANGKYVQSTEVLEDPAPVNTEANTRESGGVDENGAFTLDAHGHRVYADAVPPAGVAVTADGQVIETSAPVLTDGDAVADLNGEQRPDNGTTTAIVMGENSLEAVTVPVGQPVFGDVGQAEPGNASGLVAGGYEGSPQQATDLAEQAASDAVLVDSAVPFPTDEQRAANVAHWDEQARIAASHHEGGALPKPLVDRIM